MATVNRGQAGVTGPGLVAAQDGQQVWGLRPVRGPTQFGCQAVVEGDPVRIRQGRGTAWGGKAGSQMGKAVQPREGQGRGRDRGHAQIVGNLQSQRHPQGYCQKMVRTAAQCQKWHDRAFQFLGDIPCWA